MATYYLIDVPVGTTGNTYPLKVDFSTIGAWTDEEYKSNPIIDFYYLSKNGALPATWFESSATEATITGEAQYDYRVAISAERIAQSGEIRAYTRPDLTTAALNISVYYGQGTDPNNLNIQSGNYQYFPAGVLSWNDYRIAEVIDIHIATNIPIFATTAEMQEYIQYGDNIEDAVNNSIPSVSGRDFAITNVWTTGTWTPTGYQTVSGATVGHRDVRGRIVSGEIALYPEPWDGGDKLYYNVIDNASYEALEYSLDGVVWLSSQTFPFDFIYKERTNELGTFSYK